MVSKIKQIVLENFMAFSNAVIDFDEQGIINLKGYSDSGKSSILIAVAVVFNNFKANKQANWIKDECKYFRIEVNFEDGTRIVRYKYSNGQSLYEMFQEGYLVYSSKVNNQLTPINEVPEVIANYLNLAKLQSGVLNFRTNQDKQFLAQTTGRENFEDLNNLFGIEEILWAINSCKGDIAKYNSEMQQNSMEIEYLQSKVGEVKDLSQETLVRVLEEDKLLDLAEVKSRELSLIWGHISVLEKVKNVPEIAEVSSPINNLFELNSLVRVLGEGELVGLSEVPCERLKSLNRVNEILLAVGTDEFGANCEEVNDIKLKILIDLNNLVKGIKPVKSVFEFVTEQKSTSLESLNSYLEEVLILNDKIKGFEFEIDKMKNALSNVKEKLKAKGYVLHECSNCGSFDCEGVH